MSKQSVEEKLIAIIDADRTSGAMSWYPSHQMANLALRRWRSFPRRNRAKNVTDERRIADLAKGLKEHFDEANHDSLTEYMWLARLLAKVLVATPGPDESNSEPSEP